MIDKRIAVEDIKSTIRGMTQFDNIYPYANFMFGLPGEKYEDVIKTFNLIDLLSNENKKFYCGISIYTPYPKTPLYNESLKMGFKAPAKLEEWGHYQYNEITNLPWIKGRLKSVIRTVSLFTHFKFNQLLIKDIDVPRKNPFYVLAYLFFSLSAKIRWRFKIFRFPFEWRLYEIILKYKRIVER